MCCGHLAMYDHAAGSHEPPHTARPVDPLAQATPGISLLYCPACNAPVQDDFVFCPHCGRELLTACPACHRAVRADWTHCAFCGADLLVDKPGTSVHSHH